MLFTPENVEVMVGSLVNNIPFEEICRIGLSMGRYASYEPNEANSCLDLITHDVNTPVGNRTPESQYVSAFNTAIRARIDVHQMSETALKQVIMVSLNKKLEGEKHKFYVALLSGKIGESVIPEPLKEFFESAGSYFRVKPEFKQILIETTAAVISNK